MASLKDIKRRIVSVKNTQKITNTMKLVSAAKFSRSNQAVIAARPYTKAFTRMVERFAASSTDSVDHPLMRQSPESKDLLVLIATDRGLCGSLNTNLFKLAARWIEEKKTAGIPVDVLCYGRRAALYAKKKKYNVIGLRELALDKPDYKRASDYSQELIEAFTQKGYSRVYVAYVEFKSAMTQMPKVDQLLPFGVSSSLQGEDVQRARNMIIEPSRALMIDGLLRRSITGRIFNYLLEGQASEHGSRMTAMDSATKNAKEVIRKLSLQYNRGRQAAITKELIEITSGADAL